MRNVSKTNLAVFLLLFLAAFVAVPHSAHAQKDEETLDLDNDKDFQLKDTSDDDAQFEKELELKLDDDKADSNTVKKEAKPEAAKNDVKAEAKPEGDEKKDEDTGFDAFDEKSGDVKVTPAPEPEGLKTDTSTPVVEAESPSMPVNDEPDLKYEGKLHDIYVNFYSSKTPENEWQTLVGTHSSERYQIHTGDNLWNISKTLFGDGNYWPKVWSLNSKVTNPHLVTTNNQIRFMLGDESGPPAFTVTENATSTTNVTNNVTNNVSVENKTVVNEASPPAPEQQQGQVAGAPGDISEGDNAEPELPPPLKVSRPVLKKLPPSLPEWQDGSSLGEYDSLGIDYGHRKILEVKDQIPLTGYVAETAPKALGVVQEVEVGENMASAFQYIYVLMNKGEGQVGETYLAIANRGEVQSVHESITGFLGFSIDVLGEVQLVERVDAKEGTIAEMYRALVLKIVSPVTTSAILVQGKVEDITVTEKGPRSQVVSQIIGGSFFNRRQVYGNQSISFINRGEVDGLEEGQILPIRANRSIRNAETAVAENIRPIGWMRIVKTTPHFATGLVIRVWSDVLSGDLTGSGELLPQAGQVGARAQPVKSASAKKLIEELDEDEDLGEPPTTEKAKPAPKADDNVDDVDF